MIHQIIPSEVCLSCGGCCRFKKRDSAWSPTLSHAETRELLDGLIPAAFITENKKLRLIVDHSGENNYICPCLNVRDDTCTVYPRRPLECQLYPFVLALVDARYVVGVDAQCPFVEQNLLDPKFKKYCEEIIAYLQSAPGRYILQKNPHLFQEYSGIVVLSELNPHDSTQKTTAGS